MKKSDLTLKYGKSIDLQYFNSLTESTANIARLESWQHAIGLIKSTEV